ncbi:MAG: hypothetical protein ACREPS_00335 [Rhodanobacteraceae bacterium]
MTNAPDNIFKELSHDDEVVSRARAIFRSACEGADSYHTLRIGLARRRALNALEKRSPLRVWAPLAGVAIACCVLALGIAFLRPGPTPVVGSSRVASSSSVAPGESESSDVIPDVDSSQMEMVQNLDFYRWFASQQNVTATTPKGGS